MRRDKAGWRTGLGRSEGPTSHDKAKDGVFNDPASKRKLNGDLVLCLSGFTFPLYIELHTGML